MENKDNTNTTEVKSSEKQLPKMPSEVKLNFEIPEIKEFLKTGAQFGHQTQRWNPKMAKYIFGKKGNVHIIDLAQTLPLLENSLKFLVSASQKGRVLFVGTKKQSATIIESEAKRSGAYYVNYRWPGGLFTNFKMIKKSLKRLNQLEEDFEAGIEGRTKYEISRMKKEWERLDRLYCGVKTMDRKPRALVVVDPQFEKIAVRESIRMGVPVIAMIDTNCDPDGIHYPVPANDDALRSLKLFLKLFGDAVLQGNSGKGVIHERKDYSKEDIKVKKDIKHNEEEDSLVELEGSKPEVQKASRIVEEVKQVKKTPEDKVGILGRSREKQATFKIKVAKEESKIEEPKVKEEKKVVEKEEKKPVAKKKTTSKPKAKK